MFSHRTQEFKYFTIFGDTLAALAAFGLAYLVRGNLVSLRELYSLEFYPWLLPLVVGLWLSAGVLLRIYRDAEEATLDRALLDPIKLNFLATLLLFSAIFALKLEHISRLLLIFYVGFDLLLMVLFRLLMRAMGERLGQWLAEPRHYLIVGGTPEALEIGKILESGERLGARLFGWVSINGEDVGVGHSAPGAYRVFQIEEVPDLIRRHVIDEVIFAVSRQDLEKLEATFLFCEQEGVKTRVLLNVFPHSTSHVYLERLQGIPLLTFSSTPPDESLLFLKRAVDVFMALGFLTIVSPLLLLLGIAVRLTSPGPVFYRQERCGLGGRRFTLFKFRSMREGSEELRSALEGLNERDGAAFKIRNDPRCTLLGAWMRRFSLDELPQLLNVLKGDMSFVGPRPPIPEEVEKYEGWQRRRLRMKPGLTCLWALEGRSDLSFRRWMELDLQYIDNWSPALDWKIILKTIPVVLMGRGAS